MEQDETLKQAIVDDRAAGLTFRQIAEKRGAPLSRVYRLAKAPEPADATTTLLGGLAKRAEPKAPAPPPSTENTEEAALQIVVTEIGRRAEEVANGGPPVGALELKRLMDAALRASELRKAREEASERPSVDFTKASLDELRLLRLLHNFQNDLRRREVAPARDPMVALALRVLEESSLRGNLAAPPTVVAKVTREAETALAKAR